MPKFNMYKVLQSALVEKDVENAYREALNRMLICTISSPHGTDGLIEANHYRGEDCNLIMLMECKYDFDFSKRLEIIKVLVQALYYLKKFEDYGEDLPNVILVGDINECFCLHSNDLKPYLSEDLDWSLAPSSAAAKNLDLINQMHNDNTINYYVYHIVICNT